MSKECLGCHVSKDLSEFSKNKNKKDGLQKYCKECMKKYNKNNREKLKSRDWSDIIIPCEKYCPWCDNIKPNSEFTRVINNPSGLNDYCRSCRGLQDKSYQENNKLLYDSKTKKETKLCQCCKLTLPSSQFYTNRNNVNGLTPYCISCSKINWVIKSKKMKENILTNSKDVNKDTILYVLRFTNIVHNFSFYKIGITQLSVKNRYQPYAYKDYKYEIIKIFYDSFEVVKNKEWLLINEHNENNLGFEFPNNLNYSFAGWTECVRNIDKTIFLKYGLEI